MGGAGGGVMAPRRQPGGALCVYAGAKMLSVWCTNISKLYKLRFSELTAVSQCTFFKYLDFIRETLPNSILALQACVCCWTYLYHVSGSNSVWSCILYYQFWWNKDVHFILSRIQILKRCWICSRVDIMACLMISARRLDATLCHVSVVSAATRPPSSAVYGPYRNSPVLQRNRPYRYATLWLTGFTPPTAAGSQVLTKDSVTVSVDAVVYYRVSNATVSVANVENAHHSTRLLAQTTLRNVLGTKNLSEILSEREAISNMMQVSRAPVMWSETVGLIGQDRSRTNRNRSWSCRSGVVLWTCYARRHNDLEGQSNFSSTIYSFSILCSEHHYGGDQQWRSLT